MTISSALSSFWKLTDDSFIMKITIKLNEKYHTHVINIFFYPAESSEPDATCEAVYSMKGKAQGNKASIAEEKSPKQGDDSVVQKSLNKILECRKTAIQKQVSPELDSSQALLRDELLALCDEMDTLSHKVEAIGVDQHTQTMIRECKESLLRTKKTLTTVNARVGRLSKFEEASKLKRKSDG